MLIDTHVHLFQENYQEEIENIINRAFEKEIDFLINVGYNEATNLKTIQIINNYPQIFGSVGYHPSDVNKITDTKLLELEKLLDNKKIIAIGECGLDYYWHKDNKDLQKEFFIKQIELAIKYNLPIIVHCRDAIEDTLKILKKYQGKITGVMHCFTGSIESAKEFVKIGFYISLGGVVTFKNAVGIKKVAEQIDVERLLIETDCPYLAPSPYRGQKNEPSYLVYILEEIAKLRNTTTEDIAKKTRVNAMKLFGIKENLNEKNNIIRAYYI